MAGLKEIAPRHSKAARLEWGKSIRVINTHGSQVVDTWAFNADDLAEFMSMEHSRPTWQRTMPQSCTENLHLAMAELGLKPPEVSCPLNTWINIPVRPNSLLSFEPTVSKPGDHVLLRVEMNVIVVFSACRMDLTPINGLKTLNAHFQIA